MNELSRFEDDLNYLNITPRASCYGHLEDVFVFLYFRRLYKNPFKTSSVPLGTIVLRTSSILLQAFSRKDFLETSSIS